MHGINNLKWQQNGRETAILLIYIFQKKNVTLTKVVYLLIFPTSCYFTTLKYCIVVTVTIHHKNHCVVNVKPYKIERPPCLLLMIVGNSKIRCRMASQCRRFHTKFRENWSASS